MATKWNLRKLGYGSGAVVAALSTVFAFSPGVSEKASLDATVTENDPSIERPSLAKARHAKIISSKQGTTKIMDRQQALQEAIEKSRKLCKRVRTELGLPGLVVGISVNGRMVWQEGFGYADLEKNVRMKPEHILRIASISKSMTMAMLAKLLEEGKIDIDKPVQTYLPTYPEKCVDGEKVTITTRHLLSHLSGIRHYKKKETEQLQENNAELTQLSKKENNNQISKKTKRKDTDEDEMSLAEYFMKQKFATVEDALKLFQDDELFHKPGTKYLYTTHGWTVVSAIIEKLSETDFKKHSRRMFDFWGLKNTYLDVHEPIIYNRSSYYTRLRDGIIINAPYVDNSYKWAGGGFLSNVADLNKFAHILLYSMQTPEGSTKACVNGLPKTPFLKQSTMRTIWTGNPTAVNPVSPDFLYALGFVVGEPLRKCMFCKERDLMTVLHSGAAIGSSSVLLMSFPKPQQNDCDIISNRVNESGNTDEVKGVVVSMITNMTSVGLRQTAQEIANNFRILI